MSTDLLTRANLTAPGELSPEATIAIEEWKFPQELRLGDRVICGDKPNDLVNEKSTRRWPGVITRVDHRTADIGFIGGRFPRTSCRHIDDPELIVRPWLVEDSSTGVFRLADSELEMREMSVRLDKLDLAVAGLASDVSPESRYSFDAAPPYKPGGHDHGTSAELLRGGPIVALDKDEPVAEQLAKLVDSPEAKHFREEADRLSGDPGGLLAGTPAEAKVFATTEDGGIMKTSDTPPVKRRPGRPKKQKSTE